jgi:hypothetical protein
MKSKPGRGRRRRTIDTNEFLAMAARIVTAAGERVAEADAEDLRSLIALREVLDEAIVAAVAGLRDSGTTWEDIGAATGTTRQAAIMKWAKRV